MLSNLRKEQETSIIMDVKGFALQSCLIRDNKSNYKEESAVLIYCALNKIPHKVCNRSEDRPEGYIPVGKVEWCENFLPKEKTIPDYYPEFLKDYLFRKVWKTDTWPMSKGVFVKLSDHHKRFTGFITIGGYRKKKRGPLYCSEVVKFTNEWRYYVAEGKVLTGNGMMETK